MAFKRLPLRRHNRDEKGATAMLRSLARLPHARAAGASAAIVELDARIVATRTPRAW